MVMLLFNGSNKADGVEKMIMNAEYIIYSVLWSRTNADAFWMRVVLRSKNAVTKVLCRISFLFSPLFAQSALSKRAFVAFRIFFYFHHTISKTLSALLAIGTMLGFLFEIYNLLSHSEPSQT